MRCRKFPNPPLGMQYDVTRRKTSTEPRVATISHMYVRGSSESRLTYPTLHIAPRQQCFCHPIPFPHLALQAAHIPPNPFLADRSFVRCQEPRRLGLFRAYPEEDDAHADSHGPVDYENPDPVGDIGPSVDVSGTVRDETTDERSQALQRIASWSSWWERKVDHGDVQLTLQQYQIPTLSGCSSRL